MKKSNINIEEEPIYAVQQFVGDVPHNLNPEIVVISEEEDVSDALSFTKNGFEWEVHADKYCSDKELQSGITTVKVCKEVCAADANCKYVSWKSSGSCWFSKDCSFDSRSDYAVCEKKLPPNIKKYKKFFIY